MIGSSFLNSSACSSERVFLKEFPPLDCVLDMGVDGNFNYVDSCGTWEEQSINSGGSPVHSFGSEDCDFLAVTEDLNSMLPFPESLTREILEEEGIDLIELDNLNWQSFSNFIDPEFAESTNEVNLNVTESPRKKRIHPKSSRHNTKSWSRMSEKERLKTANTLTDIISHQMGLQEQLKVIKLIDPNAVLPPSTTEFFINLSHLNNAKLKRICNYLNKHTSCFMDFNSLMNQSSSKVKSSRASSCRRAKRRSKKVENTLHNDEWELREKKVICQDRKEKRSGLFVQEIIIKKSNDPHEEEEEVNILE